VNLCFVEGHKTIKNETQNTHIKHTIMKTTQFIFATGLLTVTYLFAAFSTVAQITEEKIPMTVQMVNTNPSCSGSNDGVITIDITGGFPPYSVNGLEIVGSSFEVTNLVAGQYSFYISDPLLTNSTIEVQLVAPPQLEMSASVTNVSTYGGNDGAIDLTVSYPGVSYSWSTPDGSGLVPTQQDQNGLIAGVYAVTVTDLNGCETNKRFTVEQAPQGTFGSNGGGIMPGVNPNVNGANNSNGGSVN
jgi:hypothetical protein